jgi:hypothetical protein
VEPLRRAGTAGRVKRMQMHAPVALVESVRHALDDLPVRVVLDGPVAAPKGNAPPRLVATGGAAVSALSAATRPLQLWRSPITKLRAY